MAQQVNNLTILSTTEMGLLDIPTQEILLRSMPSNVDTIWIGLKGNARENFSFPLEPGESLTMPLSNLNQLDFVFDNSADRIAALYIVGG